MADEQPQQYSFVQQTPKAREAVAPQVQQRIAQLRAESSVCPMCGGTGVLTAQPTQPQSKSKSAPQPASQPRVSGGFAHIPMQPPAGKGFGPVIER